MQTDHERVCDRNERVVDLEVGNVFDAEFFHQIEVAPFAERKERAAVTVRSQSDGVFRRHQHLSGVVDCGHESLGEEVDGILRQTEEAVRLEEITGGFIVEFAGHDEPVNAGSIFFGDAVEAFREILEESFVEHRSDRIGSLRTVETETRSLSAGDCESGCFSGADEFHTLFKRLLVKSLLFRIFGNEGEVGCGREVGGDLGDGLVHHIVLNESGKVIPVDCFDLLLQFVVFGSGELVERIEDVRLIVFLESFGDIHNHLLYDLIFSGASESAGAASGFREFRGGFELNVCEFCDDHLRDAVSAFDFKRFIAEIEENGTDFSAVSGIDSSGTVEDADSMFESESAAGSDLSFISDGQFDCESGRHESDLSRFEDEINAGPQIISCIIEMSFSRSQIAAPFEHFEFDGHTHTSSLF